MREPIAAAGFIYLLRPRWHSKSFRTATRFPMPTTHEQPDFAHCKSLVFCSLQPTKSACSAAAEKCLSDLGQPLSSVSGRKRYNTLDFASKIVCQQGCCAPLLETQRQRGAGLRWRPQSVKRFEALTEPTGETSLCNPSIFLAGAYTGCKNAACHACSENTKGSPSLAGTGFLFLPSTSILSLLQK